MIMDTTEERNGGDPTTPTRSGEWCAVNTVRRSGRSRKAPLRPDDLYAVPPTRPSKGKTTETKTTETTETIDKPNRPKRKAAEAARERAAPEDLSLLQEEIFAPMDIDERKEYRGWVELESEPAFFNAMLQDLNAKAFKVHELFSLDEETLATLPNLAYGLIFLFEWVEPRESSESREDCPENLWFGNQARHKHTHFFYYLPSYWTKTNWRQTTTNACATVALMNIIMNTSAVELGPELEEFRNMTKSLAPPHRGHALDTNDFIRAIHNSVARRNDLLSEDLLLHNKHNTASRKAKAPAKKKRGVGRRRARSSESGAYHYIAFVPVDDQVWELDGLEEKPLCLGPYPTDTMNGWLSVAAETIQNYMASQNDEYLSFNLLAICQSPLVALSQQIAVAKESGASAAEVAALEAEYNAEMATIDESVDMIHARRRDYTPAIHEWVRILAEKGVLHDMIQEMDKST
ncbi:ubiquitin carboxyl-terminal hydrolase [Nemania sp. FL0916]|nr:ubiquitin carboxyl-terminal hydrolase [Nemania sp. FL0916]